MFFYSNIGDPVLFWILRLIVLLAFFLSGYLISYRDRNGINYWKYSSICIIVYSLIEGLRWNRGVDYPHYYQDLTGALFTDYDEIVYLAWIQFFKFIGLPYWVGFIFYSFLFVYGFCFLIKKFKKQAIWALPLFFIVTISSSENLIRQFLAMSMFEFALYFFLEKKYFKSIVFTFLTFQTHLSVILAILVALFIHYTKFDKIIKTSYLIVVFYLLLYYSWDPSYLGSVTKLLSTISISESSSMSSYLENADFWFSNESSLSERLGYTNKVASIFSSTMSLVTTCIIIKYGFDLTQKEGQYRIMYWFTFISYILLIFSNNGDFEIWARLSVLFRFISPILIAGIVTNLSLKKIEKYFIYMFVGVYFLYNSFFSMWGQSVMGCAFIWDR